MSRLKITEIFVSIQGEADAVGWPTSSSGSPAARCAASTATRSMRSTAASGARSSRCSRPRGESGVRHVCVTGGEPLAQKACLACCSASCDAGFSVSLETSGAIDVSAVDPRVVRVVDLKTPRLRRDRTAIASRTSTLLHAARPDQVRDLRPRRLRVGRASCCGHAARRCRRRCCSRRARGAAAGRASWRTGSSPTGCRCACRCSCTSTCGATCPGDEHHRAAPPPMPPQPCASCCSPAGSTRRPCSRSRAREGFACHALGSTTASGTAPSSTPRRAWPRRSSARSSIASCASTWPASAAPRSPTRRSPCPRTAARLGGIPVTYVPARNTVFLVAGARLGRGAAARATSSSASTPSTTPATRTAGPSSSRRSSAGRPGDARRASRAQRLRDPRAADRT